MAYRYALGDIHGCFSPLREALANVDLTDPENQVVFLGDYISRGLDSCRVLYHIKELQERYGGKQVVVLMGNHEKMFLDWLSSPVESYWIADEDLFRSIKSLLTDERIRTIREGVASAHGSFVLYMAGLVQAIEEEHGELIEWLKGLPLYYETDAQIFVHAGIREDDGELWEHTTSENDFIWKYPAEKGVFYKDVISGHIDTAEVAGDRSYRGKVYCDEENHYFTDGATPRSGVVPLLKYNTITGRYSTFERARWDDGSFIWIETDIVSCSMDTEKIRRMTDGEQWI
jgi:serine/threonine protein phosphatase 1